MSDVAEVTIPDAAVTAHQVLEAWGDFIDLRDTFRSDPDEPFRSAMTVPDRRDNRARGEDYPTFRTEHDLSMIRATGDFFGKRSAGGVGALATLGNYVFSQGFIVAAQAADNVGDVSDDLIAIVNRVVNGFMERNRFNGHLDRELDNRARRHGETLLMLDLCFDGGIEARFSEPSQLTEPVANRDLEEYAAHTAGVDCDGICSSWSFGVHTPEGRFDKPLGYHFMWNPSGTSWDYIPAVRVVHVKRNVDACVKRGVSDFHCCEEFLTLSEKLLRNTSQGSAVQAAIAYIRQHIAGTTRDAAEQQRSDKATRVGQMPNASGGNRSVYQRFFPPGTVLDVSKGMEYISGPLGSERAPRFIEVVQASLRYVGTRWGMPEYMISGDASNANLSSALVAEAPFVKAREADQLFYSNHLRDLLWKVLRIAFEAGRFVRYVRSFTELQEAIALKIDPPKVATRDSLKETQADAILVDKGAMAVSTMAQRAGLDHSAEVDAGAKAAAVDPMAQLRGIVNNTPGGTTATPGTSPTTADATLNGAQITSAVEVLAGIRTGSVAPIAALELLSAVGIDRTRAQAMISATQNLPTPTQPEATPSTKPDLQTGTRPTAESVDESIRRTCTHFRNYP